MIYEDKILDYLDGALGDKESAELMHQLAVSPERRVILEQHLQLKNVISDARKPLPVPAAIEARLAERLPVIASYNRELAGAALIGNTARTPIFGRVAATIAVLLLLGTIGYFSVIRDNGTASELATSTDNLNGSQPAATPSSLIESNTQEAPPTTISSVPEKLEGISTSIVRQQNSHRDLPTARQAGIIAEEKSNAVIVNDERSASAIPEAAPADKLYTISGVENLRTEAIASLSTVGEPSTFAMRTPMEESSDIPLVLRFDYNVGEGYNQVRESDASYTTRSVRAPSGGIDYVLSPHVALGIEGSTTEIARVQETATVIDDEELGIKRVVVSNSIQSHSEFNARAMFRYTLNPYDRNRLEASIGGGAAFGESISPLVSFSVMVNSRFSDVISLTAGPMFTGTFGRSGTAAPIDVAGPVAYVYTNKPASSTLFTPNVQLKVGIRITPW